MASRSHTPRRGGHTESERACDACHFRRTKCNGGEPCVKCLKSDLHCSYDRPAKKKGPKGKTIDKLRAALGPSSIENGDPEATTSAVTLPQRSDMTPRYRSISPTSDLDFDFLVSDTPSYATDLGSSQALRRPNSTLQDTYKTPHSIAPQLVLLHDILAKSLRQYLRHVHRLFPVVDPDHLLQRFNTKVHLHDRRFAAFLLATCALALFSRSNTVSLDVRDQAAALVDMAISLHNTADLGAEPSLDCIATSMVLSAVSQILQGPAVALVRHREAIALAETLNLSDPRAYDAFDPSEKELFFRILWLLAIAERSNSLLMFRPITMKSPISSLPVSFQLRSGLSFGLQPTARLYEAISPALIDCINGRCSSSTCMLSTWTILTAHEDLKVIGTSECISDVQRADILLTGQWLHMKLWQCCATHMLLTGSPDPPELAIEYPLRLLAKTMDLVKSLSRRSIICNGHAMGKKLGNIADACQTALNLPEPLRIPVEFRSKAHAVQVLARLQCLASEVSSERWFRWENDDCDCCDTSVV